MQPHSESQLLHIRSKDCHELTPGFNTHIQVSLKEAISRKIGHKLEISISSAEIPYTFYNVSSHLQSNTLKASEYNGAGVYTTVLSDGNYDIYDLVKEVSDASSASPTNFSCTMTFDDRTSKVTLTNILAVGITLNFSDSSVRELAKMLGFDREDTFLGAGASITGQGVVNLRPIHSIFLHSNLTASNVITSENGSIENIIDKIPLGEVGPSQIITYDPYESAPFSTEVLADSIQLFELSLRDQNGLLIQMNNVRYEISLIVTQQFIFDMETDNPRHPFPEAGRARRSIHNKTNDDAVYVPSLTVESQPLRRMTSRADPGTSSLAVADPRSPRAFRSDAPLFQAAKRPRTTQNSSSNLDDDHIQKQEIELQNAILLASTLPSMTI